MTDGEEGEMNGCKDAEKMGMKEAEKRGVVSWRVNLTFGLVCALIMVNGVLLPLAITQQAQINELQDRYETWLNHGRVPVRTDPPSPTRNDPLVQAQTRETVDDLEVDTDATWLTNKVSVFITSIVYSLQENFAIH